MNPLIKIVAVFAVFAAIGLYASVEIINGVRSLVPANIEIVVFSPISIVSAIATIVIIFALIFTIPLILYELVKYVSPALYKKEKKAMQKILPLSILLFAFA